MKISDEAANELMKYLDKVILDINTKFMKLDKDIQALKKDIEDIKSLDLGNFEDK